MLRARECFVHRLRVARLGLESEVAGHVVVELRRAGCERLLGADRRRQVAILYLDQLGGVLGRSSGVGHNERHRLTDEMHPAVREHRPLRRARLHAVLPGPVERMGRFHVARLHGVGAGEHRLHAGVPERGGGVDRDDLARARGRSARNARRAVPADSSRRRTCRRRLSGARPLPGLPVRDARVLCVLCSYSVTVSSKR